MAYQRWANEMKGDILSSQAEVIGELEKSGSQQLGVAKQHGVTPTSMSSSKSGVPSSSRRVSGGKGSRPRPLANTRPESDETQDEDALDDAVESGKSTT